MKLKGMGKNMLPEVGGLAAGAIGGNMLISKIPVGNDKVKNGIGLIAGMLLMKQKGAFISNVGRGLIANSAVKLASSFGIGAPTLIGEPQDVIIEGLTDPEDFSDENDQRNFM